MRAKRHSMMKILMSIRKNKKIFPCLLSILIVVAFTFFCAIGLISSPINFDELEHLHAAWLWAHGLQPYTDFFEHHTRLFWLFLRPIVVFFDGDIFAAVVAGRVFISIVLTLLLVMSFFFYTYLFNRRVAWLAIALWLLFIVSEPGALQVRSDMLMLLLLVSGSFILCKMTEVKSLNYKYILAILGGLLLGIAALVTPKAIFWIPAFYMGWLVTIGIESKQKLFSNIKFIFISVLVVCITIASDLLYVYRFYDWEKFYNAVWVSNKQAKAVWNNHDQLMRIFLSIIHLVAAPVIVIILGVVSSISQLSNDLYTYRRQLMIWLLSFGGVILILLAKTGDFYNLFILFWIFFGFAGLALEKFFLFSDHVFISTIKIFLILLIVCFGFGKNFFGQTLFESLQPLQIVLGLKQESDTYVTERGGGGGYNPVFIFDTDTGYFMSHINPELNKKSFFEVINQKRPRFIFSASQNENLNQFLLGKYIEIKTNQILSR